MKQTWILSVVIAMTAIVGFACGGGDDATQTTPPTATSPAPTATSPAIVHPTATSPAVEDPTATSPATSNGGRTILTIGSVSSDNLGFSTETLTASAGSRVILTFNNNANTQQHNWVLVQNGTKDTVAAAGLAAGPANNWVAPDDANVIANTKLIAAGESTEVTFAAPTAGTYQFACTFPGHNLTMFGTFEVTP